MGHTALNRILLLLLLCFAVPAWALPGVGEDAPGFTFRDLSGLPKEVASGELFAGRTTLLSFFATWCKPCEKEIPQLRALDEKYGSRGFQVVLISLDQVEAGEIRDFVHDAGGDGVAALWDEDGEAMALYGVFSLPTNVLVDPAGKVRMAWQGYQEKQLRELQGLLEKLPAAGGEERPAAK